jgi:hypothetical protein
MATQIYDKFYFMKKIKLVFKITIIFFVVLKNLSISIRKLRKSQKIFIAYRGFAHTIIDVMAFLELFPEQSIVIILGEYNRLAPSFAQRNQVFPLYLGNEKIITINTQPNFGDKGLWIWAQISKKILKFMFIFLRNKNAVIYTDSRFITKIAAHNFISMSLKIPHKNAEVIFKELESSFKLAGVGSMVGHQILFMKKWSIRSFNQIYQFYDKKIIDEILQKINVGPYVCLLIRDNKQFENIPSESYYIDAIKFFFSKGFSTALCGDTERVLDLLRKERKEIKQSILNFHINDYKKLQIFDFIAAANCKFALGDPGGAWSLLKIFNKPGLLINSLATHLFDGVESLPKKWVTEKTGHEVLDADHIFNDLFFSELISKKSNVNESRVLQKNNDKTFILDVVHQYINNKSFDSARKMQPEVLNNFPQNKYLELAKNCSYSNEYLKKLQF